MNHVKKALIAALVLGAAVPAFSQNTLGALQDEVRAFSGSLAKSLPLNSSLGLNWSDAYIGPLIGLPPHFGVGVSMGMSTMDFKAIDRLLGQFGTSLPFTLDRMIIPGYTAEFRVGGFILPFDLGFKFGYLPNLDMEGIKLDYTLLGGEVRYALLEENPVLPSVSLGLGVNYLAGGIGTALETGRVFSFTEGNLAHTLALSDTDMGFSWETTALDFTAQVSKSFILITPYLGLGLNYAWSKAGYAAQADLEYDGVKVSKDDLAAIRQALKTAGISGLEVDTGSLSSIIENQGLGLRAFGGLSLNIVVVKVDLTGMYSFLSGDYGFTLGLRFQL
jgi:hypothetical protein